MQRCLSPIIVKNPRFEREPWKPRFNVVPCGKCYACLQNKRDHWTARLTFDAINALDASFVTLTYDDDHCPEHPVKEHIQNFIRMLRLKIDNYHEIRGNLERLDFDIKTGEVGKTSVIRHFPELKYVCVSEYGSKTGRPHYHMILLNTFDPQFIDSTWKYGFSKTGEVNAATIKYTLKYMLDSEKGDNFALYSKGIGLSIVNNKYLESFYKNPEVLPILNTPDGNSYSLPRYVKDKWDLHYEPQSFEEFLQSSIDFDSTPDKLKTQVHRFESYKRVKQQQFDKLKKANEKL